VAVVIWQALPRLKPVRCGSEAERETQTVPCRVQPCQRGIGKPPSLRGVLHSRHGSHALSSRHGHRRHRAAIRRALAASGRRRRGEDGLLWAQGVLPAGARVHVGRRLRQPLGSCRRTCRPNSPFARRRELRRSDPARRSRLLRSCNAAVGQRDPHRGTSHRPTCDACPDRTHARPLPLGSSAASLAALRRRHARDRNP